MIFFPRFPARRPTNLSSARQSRPQLETLEDRQLLSISVPTGDQPGPVIIKGTPGPDDFVIGVSRKLGPAAAFEFSDDGGKTRVTVLQSLVTEVIVAGGDGDDRLTIDHSYGFFGTANGLPITYDAGTGTDQLVVRGDPRRAVDQVFAANAQTGGGKLVSLSGDLSNVVTYSRLAEVIDTMPATTLTVEATDGADLIRLLDGPIVDGFATNRVTFSDPKTGAAVFTPISFANKVSVTLNARGGDDQITIDSKQAATGLKKLTVDGGEGYDTVTHVNDPAGVAVASMNVEMVVFTGPGSRRRLPGSASR